MAQRQRKKGNIPMRDRLSALYRKGEEVRFNEHGVVNRTKGELEARNAAIKEALREGVDEPDEDVDAIWPTEDDEVIYVTPPSPLQREMALREASAARARFVLAAKRDEDSTDAVATRASVVEMDLEELVDIVLELTEGERRDEAERNVLAEEEWEDFTELQDAMRQWAEADDPDADEWKPLLKRDLEFGRQNEEEYQRLTEGSRESLKIVARDDLEERAIKKIIEVGGNAEFMSEYQMWMMHYACRDGSDHDSLAFDHPDDIQGLPELASEALASAYRKFIESEKSAKNSPRAEDGSPQLPLPEELETSGSSTPEESTTSETSPGSSRSPSTTD